MTGDDLVQTADHRKLNTITIFATLAEAPPSLDIGALQGVAAYVNETADKLVQKEADARQASYNDW
eukprot:6023311-Pyramimonas_sp.AAC.1